MLNLQAQGQGRSLSWLVATMLCLLLILAFMATVYMNFGAVIG
ncbi:hypothetical protein ACFOGJ_14620 [Marinibaculum pumilum]|uniref:Uncharacterized protein n=1 Tax=Marinibaculum pumilum TaxID=1766165 RepID=A0ABV7L1F7_9PROT